MFRREFLKQTGLATAFLTGGVPTLAFSPQEEKEIFVLIFLRGGMDGLQLVAPASDKFYMDARSAELRITEKNGLLLKNPLNNLDFRLHAKAKPLKELYDGNRLAIIHACGLANGTRSHFDAMDLIEKGIPQKKNVTKGWLARYLETTTGVENLILPAVAVGDQLPVSYLGSDKAVSLYSAADFSLKGDEKLSGILKSWYNQPDALGQTARNALKNIASIEQKLPKNTDGSPKEYHPDAAYPTEWYISELSNNLKNLAQLIKMDTGLHVATVNFGGWDTHDNQTYVFPQLTEALSRSVAAFYNDLSRFHARLTVVVMSEFGRRLKGNRSGGTDHGHGNVMLVLGQKTAGGKMYGSWRGLATEQLDNGVDVPVTTDYRTVLGEILLKRLKNNRLDVVFPEFKIPGYLGIAA
ncbi:MAG: DUF1501 domain-containing protein [Cytophagales bacterium]|jgi:uncharacterized protein (DUF1501 family)|nr:DUF1501 domain-containing protein [Cytophagales bacterium]